MAARKRRQAGVSYQLINGEGHRGYGFSIQTLCAGPLLSIAFDTKEDADEAGAILAKAYRPGRRRLNVSVVASMI